jgi:hypothetical protein
MAAGEQPMTGRRKAASAGSRRLPVRAARVPGQAQDVPAPDQVSGRAGHRQVLGGADAEGDAVAGPGGGAGGRHAPRDGIEAGDLEAEAPGQLDGMLAFAAPDVDRCRSGREPQPGDVLVQCARPGRAEGLVEPLAELRLDAVERVMGAHQEPGVGHPPMLPRPLPGGQ